MQKQESVNSPIRLLIVDDSWILRRVLRGTLSQRDEIEIVGEANNGIEALGLILKLSPDVILLDVEMPVMDGLTTLQHLMIHTPTPTIMLSSLSKPGSPRCFDALKYGAVDFIYKNSFFKGIDGTAHNKLVTGKISDAARVKVCSIDPMHQDSEENIIEKPTGKILFCEDCGFKNIIKGHQFRAKFIQCRRCGDELNIVGNRRYQRMNYLTVIGAGASNYGNLLKIIPLLDPNMGGAVFVIILDESSTVKSFVKYLDAISDVQVSQAMDGMAVDGGCCYFFSSNERAGISSYTGQYTIQIDKQDIQIGEFLDSFMETLSQLFKDRVSGVLLSGDIAVGDAGMEIIDANGGTCLLLDPEYSMHKRICNNQYTKNARHKNFNEFALAREIQARHFSCKENVITA